MTGSPQLVVPAKGEAEYKLSMCPQFGGVFTGSLTFTAPAGVVTWFTVEVRIALYDRVHKTPAGVTKCTHVSRIDATIKMV